jgi:hypothetical protein
MWARPREWWSSADYGALTDAAWTPHCQITSLPSVPQIVHTFFE